MKNIGFYGGDLRLKKRNIKNDFREITRTDIDSTDFHVVLKNDLFLSETNLNLNENKIVFAVISQVMKADTVLPWFSIKTKDLCKLCNFDENNIYKILKNIRENICTKILKMNNQLVRYKDGSEEYKDIECTWLDAFAFDYEKGTWDVHINPQLKYFILNLKNNFTSERLSSYLKYKTTAGFRLHSYFSVNFDKKTSKFSLEKKENYVLRVRLSLEKFKKMTNSFNKYSLYSSFKERVLKPGIREINRYGFYSVSYEEIKEGKRIVGFYFFVRLGKKNERIEKIARDKLINDREGLFNVFKKYFSFSNEEVNEIKLISTDELMKFIGEGKKDIKRGASIKDIKENILLTIKRRNKILTAETEKIWNMF